MISFRDFIQAAYEDDRCPYPWQERFAEHCVCGTPPALVGVPTGCGKTTVVDALVWALACQADEPAARRTVGARIVWAIDRRILVDEVHAHASTLAARLLSAQGDAGHPLKEMADRLAGMARGVPLVATRWRGGVPLRRALYPPTQAQVITSTIAQVGSRLLFRGYGVRRGSLAVEAGLAGCDTTVCLDEAHIAEPFRQTVAAVRARRAETEQELGLPGLGVITLTATPAERAGDVVALGAEDWKNPELRRRLEAPKLAHLEDAPPTERERVKLLAATSIGYVHDGAPTVACVVNTVKRARDVLDLVSRELNQDEGDITLLVGPQRPADRESLLDRYGDRLFGGKDSARPLICIATQTFEVGLDADVAAMVTDSASASALVQRLGRLNRRGGATGRATIIRDEDSWLYAGDEQQAWDWLKSREGPDSLVDVSVAALQADRSRPEPTTIRSAPSLTDSALELLVQTDPQPGPWQEPSVDGFLRGAEDQASTDVTICWRCDLLPDVGDPAAEGYRAMVLELVPPQDRELLPLSLKGARALIAARYASDNKPGKAAGGAVSDADLEGGAEAASVPEPTRADVPAPFLVVRRGEVLHGTLSETAGGRLRASDLMPGDTLVLPTQAGGVDSHGLAPTTPAGNTADAARNDVAGDRLSGPVRSGGSAKPVPVRLSPAALGIAGENAWPQIHRRCRQVADKGPSGDPANAVEELVDELAGLFPAHTALSLLAPGHRALLEQPIRILLRAIGPVDEGDLPILDEEEIDAVEGTDDQDLRTEKEPDSDRRPDGGPGAAVAELKRTWVLVPVPDRERDRRRRGKADPPPTLEAHATAVRKRLDEFTAHHAFPDSVRSALSLAAAGHDHGKADPRIQAFFNGGVRPLGAEPIAKSIFGTDDPRTERLARAAAGLPRGLRHEIGSVAAVQSSLAGAGELPGVDWDLALHLIATHHGRGRPVPPSPSGGDDPQPFHVDAAGIAGQAIGDGEDGWDEGAWLRRFWRVVDRYGEWGTAYLEALLVVADRTVSSEGG